MCPRLLNSFGLPVALLLGLSGCFGGGDDGGSGTVSGLSLPSSVDVITPTEEAEAGGVAAAARVRPAAVTDIEFPTDSDYATDETRVFVYDPSMQPLDTVNMILCLMAQTRAADLVNTGAYFALVNEDKCEQGQNQSSTNTTGQSSGTVTELNQWTVEATRASDADPMIVHIWVPGDAGAQGPDAQNIVVEVTATAAVSDSLPFGDFSMAFAGLDADEIVGMQGSLATSDAGLGFEFFNAEDNPDFTFEQAAHVVFDDTTGSGGTAKTRHAESGGFGSSDNSFTLAFDATRVLLSRNLDAEATDDCLARDQFTSRVWRYNLYDDTGTLVELNSGFPFTYAADGGSNHGFVGYNGVWTEGEQTPADGTVITQMDFGSGTSTEYTLNVSPGKLIRREANTLPLSDLVGERLYYWGPNPDTDTFGKWEVQVSVEGLFEIVGSVEFQEAGPAITPAAAIVDITPTETGQNLWLWSDSLGGNIVYVHDPDAVTPVVTFYAESFVYPDDATLFASGDSVTLHCFDRCLKGGLSAEAVGMMTTESDLYYANDGTDRTYTLESSGGQLLLRDDANDAVVDASTLDLDMLGHDWGVQSGEMLTDISSIVNPWEVYNQPVSFRWETGDNHWNQFVVVTDSDGAPVSFDRPMQFQYTVDAGDDFNDDDHAGKTFFVQYGGPGDLWGFPWVENDDEKFTRWYPEVNLNQGVELNDGTDTFVVKPMEMEQTLVSVDAAECSSLSLGDADLLTLLDQSAVTVSFGWSDRPTPASDAPAVVEGELQ